MVSTTRYSLKAAALKWRPLGGDGQDAHCKGKGRAEEPPTASAQPHDSTQHHMVEENKCNEVHKSNDKIEIWVVH